jgi:hypothetical protein
VAELTAEIDSKSADCEVGSWIATETAMLAARAHSLAAEAKTLVEEDMPAAAGPATQLQEVKSTVHCGSGSVVSASSSSLSAGTEPPSKRQRVDEAALAATAAAADAGPSAARRRLSDAVLASFDRWKQSVPLSSALVGTLEEALRSRLDLDIEPLPDRSWIFGSWPPLTLFTLRAG